ncbi:MAG: thioredoxin family protein [Candidatus Izemoplasmatales bacterium]|jgi:thioredoxin-like negative regulator of GroEL|nr:thioredoxin family protein [Acholeplasmataceae bacterium]
MKIVFITASWCSSCLLMRSRLNKAIAGIKNVTLIELDFDQDAKIIESFTPGNILPVIILYRESQELKRFVGEVKSDVLTKAIIEASS